MSQTPIEKHFQSFLKKHPKVSEVEAYLIDPNAVPVGKWIPRSNAVKLAKGIRMPRSIFAHDIWGQDVLPARLVAETGDGDGVCYPIPDTLVPMPWLKRPTAQVIMSMADDKGLPFFGDPRFVLSQVLTRYKKHGLTPVVAAELEFYLIDGKRDEYGAPQPPKSLRTNKRHRQAQLLSLSEMREFDRVLLGIADACAQMGVVTDTAISENGPGQYEINLLHMDDALKAADHAVMMKRAVKGVAQQHGFDATFMAKPYAGLSGSGMHVHFSVLDKKGKNIFAGKDKKGAVALRHAVGGLMKNMADSMAFFAPHANSYRRLVKGSHAPTKITWGYDNRSASIRIPESDIANTRIEHRVAGADTNPYLVLAAILAAALDGIEKKIDPGAANTGNVYNAKAKTLPVTWVETLALLEKSKFVKEAFGIDYQKLYLACKSQEKETIEGLISNVEYEAYLTEV